MQGLERGVLAPSSLHLFWDVMGKLGKDALVLADDKVYQVARWGLERAACHGASVLFFEHHNPKSLEQQLKRQCTSHCRMVFVLTDGWCPHCGKAAPLPQYLALARKHNGFLLIDDTQALGVLGKSPTRRMPYGEGGGGLLQWFGLRGQDIITICSLAKGFGVPVSVMSGSASWINQFVRQSETRVHSSPVSVAHVHAALHALSVNRKHGQVLRQKLLQNVRRFRKSVSRLGFSARGSFFPVQTLRHSLDIPPQVLYQKLSEMGIKALLLESHESIEPRVSFCLSASHTTDQLRRMAVCLSKVSNFVTLMV
ncbi:aminotransferase class I/II-fold pyridoxal phosphate-dependent enzyme [Pontibacter toksunensis]|uniref:Aminotransferase class I/II-fold pyridoxal phosphate-dependent enzyme n=1 Tax=Pontibacter toksunensis TaxID=1332631 RepID=A0ABW6C1I5_9BACT